MGKAIYKGWAPPDHPMYKEGLRSYSPDWAHAYLKSKKASPETTMSDEEEWRNMWDGKPPNRGE